MLAALRLGLYELLYLSGAPDRAVVADAVELAKAGDGRSHGLVNAVLRRAAREGAARLLGTLGEETPERAAIAHSHPQWLARMWWERLGAADARALMAHDNEPGELALRANTLVTDAPALAAELARVPVALHRDPSLAEALVLDGPFDVHGSPLWAAGAFLAQSRAAMLVARALDPQRGERVLDLCAAPGGKTHAPRRADGRRGRGRSRSSATRAAPRRSSRRRGGCARATFASRSATRRASAPGERRSTACSSTRRARGSGRCRRAPTCAGASRRTAITQMARRRPRFWPPGRGRSVRAACLSTLRARSPRLRTSA